MSKRLKLILPLFVLLAISITSFFVLQFAGKNTVKAAADVVITDDFTAGNNLENTNVYSYSNVAISSSQCDYGMVPSTSGWGQYVDPASGYIIYEVSPGEDKKFKDMNISFETYFGCASNGAYYGNAVTNINVYVSTDTSAFGSAVFNAHNGANYKDKFTSVEKGTTTEVYGNQSKTVTVTGDISSYIDVNSVNYIKIEFVHLTGAQIMETTTNDAWKTNFTNDGKIMVNFVGIQFHNITISASTQKAGEVTSFSDYYTKSGELSSDSFNVYASENVKKNPQGDESSTNYNNIGLVPSTTDFGTTLNDFMITPASGYLIYKIPVKSTEKLNEAIITFDAYFGCKSNGDFYGSNKSDIRVYVSDSATSFGEYVFSAHNGANYKDKFTSVEKGTTTEVYGNQSKTVTVTGNITDYLNPTVDNYVKIEIIHLTTAQMTGTGDAWWNLHSNSERTKISAAYTAVQIFSTGISYSKVPNKDKKTVNVSDDFVSAGALSSYNVLSYDTIAKSIGDANSYGIVPASSWGAQMATGIGNVVYVIAPDKNCTADGLSIDMKVNYGHRMIGFSYSYATINVYVSTDNVNYTKVFDLYNYSQYTDAFTVTYVSSGEQYTGMDTFDNLNVKGDLSAYVSNVSKTYVKIEMVHRTYDEFNSWTSSTYNKTVGEYGIGNDTTKTIDYNRIATTVQSVKLSLTEVEEEVNHGSTEYDYKNYTASDWKKTAYDTNGLSLVALDYSYKGATLSTNVIMPSSNDSEGYITYKYEAEENKTFATARMTMIARPFDNNLSGINEKIDFYISYDNETYTLVSKTKITNNWRACDILLDLDQYVFGRSVFYFKVVVGANDRTWTNFSYIKMDLTNQNVNVNVYFGDKLSQIISTVKGESFDVTQIVVPEGFTRTDDKLYSSLNPLTEFEATSLISAETNVYILGEWNKYVIEYYLDGGTNNALNPDYYYSANGAKLYAPTKDGFAFAGFYTESTFVTLMKDVPVGRTGNITLYAKWVVESELELKFSVIYVLNGGTNDVRNSEEYDSYVGMILYNATKDGCKFLGWYDENDVLVTEITAGTLGDVTLYAKFSEAPTITSARIILYSDLTFRFFATADGEEVYMRFTMGEGKFSGILVKGIKSGNEYYFDFENIAPQDMGDLIKAELLVDGVVKDVKENYSVLTYCNNLLNDENTTVATRTLIGDLLDYGAAAQIYMNYKTDNLVNANVTIRSTFVAPTNTDKNYSESTADGFNIEGSGVNFNNVNRIYVKFKAGDGYKITYKIGNGAETDVTDRVFTDGEFYKVYTDGVYATDGETIYTFTLYSGDIAVQTATYSVKSFIYSCLATDPDENASKTTLAKALWKYSLCASSYKNSEN